MLVCCVCVLYVSVCWHEIIRGYLCVCGHRHLCAAYLAYLATRGQSGNL